MKKILSIILSLGFLFSPSLSEAKKKPKNYGSEDVYVEPYTRKDGVYVEGHYRSWPNKTRADNWSTYGNTNPYTGMDGWIRLENGEYSFPSSTGEGSLLNDLPKKVEEEKKEIPWYRRQHAEKTFSYNPPSSIINGETIFATSLLASTIIAIIVLNNMD